MTLSNLYAGKPDLHRVARESAKAPVMPPTHERGAERSLDPHRLGKAHRLYSFEFEREGRKKKGFATQSRRERTSLIGSWSRIPQTS